MPTLEAMLTRSGALSPATLDREAGTVDVVLSTGAPVQRAGYIERLSTTPDAVKLAPRIPLLDSHRQGSIGDVKGRVSNVRHEGGSIVATLHVSDPAALDAIARGDVTGVSIGYRVTRWTESKDSTGARVRTASAWELIEASLVAVPADPHALVRSNAPMPEAQVQTEPSDTAANDDAVVQTRAAIRTIARTAGLDAAWADSQIDSGADVTAARAAAFEVMTTRGTPAIRAHVGASSEDPAVQNDRFAEALACRMTGAAPSDAARPYIAMGLHDMARAMLTRSGVSVTTLGAEALMQRAMHTISDFPNLLTGVGNRVLMPAYQRAESPLKKLARQTTATDFRAMQHLKVGEFGPLQEISESGEITATTTAETVDAYSLKTFARLFALSRKALINDDLGAFGRWSEMMGRAAAEMEAGQLVALLTANSGAGPALGDGKTLFHAGHGNLAATGTNLASDTDVSGKYLSHFVNLDAARLAMRKQTGLDGVTPIAVVPKYIVVAPERETEAELLVSQVLTLTRPTESIELQKLSVLVEPRLSPKTGASPWFVFGDPAVSPVLEYAYLASAQGPQLSSRDGWEVLGREFRCYEDFGCGAIDFRGVYRNPGA